MDHSAIVAAARGVSDCVDDTIGAGDAISSDMPDAAEQACLRDVTRETGTADVTLPGSEVPAAGTLVRVAVSSNLAPWQRFAYGDRSTAGIQSLTDEGAHWGPGRRPIARSIDSTRHDSSRSRPSSFAIVLFGRFGAERDPLWMDSLCRHGLSWNRVVEGDLKTVYSLIGGHAPLVDNALLVWSRRRITGFKSKYAADNIDLSIRNLRRKAGKPIPKSDEPRGCLTKRLLEMFPTEIGLTQLRGPL